MTKTTQISSAVTGNLLGVLFIGLKLTHQIDWSWTWVLAPFWLPMALVALVLFLGMLITGIAGLVSGR